MNIFLYYFLKRLFLLGGSVVKGLREGEIVVVEIRSFGVFFWLLVNCFYMLKDKDYYMF